MFLLFGLSLLRARCLRTTAVRLIASTARLDAAVCLQHSSPLCEALCVRVTALQYSLSNFAVYCSTTAHFRAQITPGQQAVHWSPANPRNEKAPPHSPVVGPYMIGECPDGPTIVGAVLRDRRGIASSPRASVDSELLGWGNATEITEVCILLCRRLNRRNPLRIVGVPVLGMSQTIA